jgi:DnaK suppressor protein
MITEQDLLAMSAQDYMNDDQLAFFRALLVEQKLELEESLAMARAEINSGEREADELDQALVEEENRHRLRMADRQSKLMRKIDKTIARIDDGDYGYCQVSGEPIGIPRLLLRPTAELCAEEKARQESRENHFIKVR